MILLCSSCLYSSQEEAPKRALIVCLKGFSFGKSGQYASLFTHYGEAVIMMEDSGIGDAVQSQEATEKNQKAVVKQDEKTSALPKHNYSDASQQ